MKEIKDPEKIMFSQLGMDSVTVLLHGKVLEPKWLTMLVPDLGYDKVLSLSSIHNQFPENGVMVIHEKPLGGAIYRFGNYDDTTWHQIGAMDGYA